MLVTLDEVHVAATAELMDYFSDAHVTGIRLLSPEARLIAGGICHRLRQDSPVVASQEGAPVAGDGGASNYKLVRDPDGVCRVHRKPVELSSSSGDNSTYGIVGLRPPLGGG